MKTTTIVPALFFVISKLTKTKCKINKPHCVDNIHLAASLSRFCNSVTAPRSSVDLVSASSADVCIVTGNSCKISKIKFIQCFYYITYTLKKQNKTKLSSFFVTKCFISTNDLHLNMCTLMHIHTWAYCVQSHNTYVVKSSPIYYTLCINELTHHAL